ncbi:BMC domain-containing protein [Acerihabitans sp. KWT182]|uniref:BMC domain-containing protein n=1 Tax=Acerihabitans sp. KWT182 TaxID=3157919 RepID=A0AAU7Q4W1_9GAMM
MKFSLGLLEVAGLALAVKAADSMAKAAAIRIAAIERTQGSGWMLVSVTGDVAAVKTAISHGAALARLENGYVTGKVISRPDDALVDLIPLPHEASAAVIADTAQPSTPASTTVMANAVELSTPASTTVIANAVELSTPALATDVCNLCGDPACPRRKGEPRGACIHYKERGNP